MDVIVSGSGLGRAELFVGGIRVGECVAISLKNQIVALGQISAHGLEAIFKIECLCLRLVAVWYTRDVFASRTAPRPDLTAITGVQTNNLTIGVFDRSLGLGKIRDAVVRLIFNFWLEGKRTPLRYNEDSHFQSQRR